MGAGNSDLALGTRARTADIPKACPGGKAEVKENREFRYHGRHARAMYDILPGERSTFTYTPETEPTYSMKRNQRG